MSQPKERPILFSGPMVRAIIDGRKTQTRRLVKNVPNWLHGGRSIMEWDLSGCHTDENGKHWLDVQIDVDDYLRNEIRCPYGEAGDKLRISEEVKVSSIFEDWFGVNFVADGLYLERPCDFELTEKIKGYKTGHLRGVHLPPAFSRPTRLEITAVRVEQLQDISEADAIAEGIESRPISWLPTACEYRYYGSLYKHDQWSLLPTNSYESLWESINGPESWDANPWVWVIEFQKVEVAK